MVTHYDVSSRLRDLFAAAELTPPATVIRLTDTLSRWHHRARTRHELLDLDDAQLADIGVSRQQAAAEARKPFWRA